MFATIQQKKIRVVNPINIQAAIQFIEQTKCVNLLVRSQLLGGWYSCQVDVSSLASCLQTHGDTLCEIPIVPITAENGNMMTNISSKGVNQIIFVQ